MASRGDHDRGQCPIQRPCCPRRNACRLDGAIEGPMKLPELLEVHSIARLVKVQYREDKGRPCMISTDATRRLSIFRGSLRLTLDNHEPKAADIETNGNHIRRQSNIYGFRFRPKTGIKALFRFRDLVRRDARGELHRFLDASVSKGSIGGSDPPALGTIARGAILPLLTEASRNRWSSPLASAK